MITHLKTFFLQTRLSEEVQEKIISKFQFRHIDKGDFLIESGKLANELAFLESGAFHYFFNIDGEIKTTFVQASNGFITSMSSFLSNTPASENIQSLTHSSIAIIKLKDFKMLVNEIPEFKNLYISMLEDQVICLDQRRLDLLIKTPEERYLQIIEEQPQLFEKIPLKLLAQTLGMTPRHLTRIRKKIATSMV